MQQRIEAGFMAFLADGEDGIGAVREVIRDSDAFVVNIENAGDFTLPMSAVRDVHSGKVILDRARLPAELREALGHLHDAEYPAYAESGKDEGAPEDIEPGDDEFGELDIDED